MSDLIRTPKLVAKTAFNATRILCGLDRNRSQRYWESRGRVTALREEQVDGFGCLVPLEELKPVLDWYTQHVVESITAHAAVGTVLDYGCGTGRYLKALSALARYQLFGIDYSATMLEEHARKQVPKAQCFCFSLTQDNGRSFIEEYSGRFTAIYSVSVLQYVPVSDICRLLHAFQQLLAPGGLLILNFPHPSSVWESCSDLNYIRYWPRFVENQLKREGLQIVQSMPSFGGERIEHIDRTGNPNHGYWIHALKR